MCSNFSVINCTKNGILVYYPKCRNFQLSYSNINLSLTHYELECFKSYVDKIDSNYWEKEYMNSIYKRKIPIPTTQNNLILLFEKSEIRELKQLMELNKTTSLLKAREINYDLYWN